MRGLLFFKKVYTYIMTLSICGVRTELPSLPASTNYHKSASQESEIGSKASPVHPTLAMGTEASASPNLPGVRDLVPLPTKLEGLCPPTAQPAVLHGTAGNHFYIAGQFSILGIGLPNAHLSSLATRGGEIVGHTGTTTVSENNTPKKIRLPSGIRPSPTTTMLDQRVIPTEG
jgi:hypothetical protein